MDQVISEIKWTPRAYKSFDSIVLYLEKQWSDREVEKFIMKTNRILVMLKSYPEMCSPSLRRKNVRIAILSKQTKLVYHYKPKKGQIEILLFWNQKQDPAKFNF